MPNPNGSADPLDDLFRSINGVRSSPEKLRGCIQQF